MSIFVIQALADDRIMPFVKKTALRNAYSVDYSMLHIAHFDISAIQWCKKLIFYDHHQPIVSSSLGEISSNFKIIDWLDLIFYSFMSWWCTSIVCWHLQSAKHWQKRWDVESFTLKTRDIYSDKVPRTIMNQWIINTRKERHALISPKS